MKAFFIKKIGVFLIPVIFLGCVEVFVLPHTFWTHRFWEAISYQKDMLTYGQFYQSQSLEMLERGDLSDGADSAIYSLNSWITDEYGFRNDYFIKNPDIILLGDSFIVGTGLNQSQILSNQLTRLYNGQIKVYNMAPVPLRTFDIMLKKGLVEKPDILVYEFAEKLFPETFVPYTSGKYDMIKVPVTNWINEYQLNLVWDKISRVHWAYFLRHKLFEEKPVYPKLKDQYLYKGENYKIFNNQDKIHSLTSLIGYKDYCDNQGIKLIVMPIPTKETVYNKVLQKSDFPKYLNGIHAGLDCLGINNINVLKVMLEEDGEYYQRQDTHWNEYGVDLAAGLLKDKIEEIQNLN
ncbi:alginate O-acetyltransferase AlgX-related protein [Echinicola shivajiensis]|uniref:alginate O-acetyltransferase AlgX-related protein n=1 Tax=Echinicola shivajiensis TaxID=1035916 RepID=UPI001BFC3223|nr:hypothetical protein [Echinicola shivajiensis]